MSIDARFDKIQEIVEHENAENLEIALVSGFQCVVRKGEFKVGEWVFYVRDDACLVSWAEERAERLKRVAEASRSGELVMQNGGHCSFPWQEDLLRFLGNGGRVRTVKLRGIVSMGILVDVRKTCPNLSTFDDEMAEWFNAQIADEKFGGEFLERNFGVRHWERPLSGGMGVCEARGGLISGLEKTDEENFQNIDAWLFPWGEEVLVTKKLDGTSCSVSASPEGEVHVMSRSLDLKLECKNVWTKAAEKVVPLVLELAKHYGETVVVRGEVCGEGINASKANLDSHGEPEFNMFGVVFPSAVDRAKRLGLYGSEWHFLEVNKVCKELTGQEIKTVPIEGVKILSKKLLEDIADMPRSEGEGRVLNTKSLKLPHFKSKSKDYLLKL